MMLHPRLSIEPLIGGLIHITPIVALYLETDYWTPYRGIEMLICLPWKGSGGGVVYGFGVWRVKSWVKNVLNTNKYIAIFLIKWGWSRLTYLSLVFIISKKSIILFYWTPYRGIDTIKFDRWVLILPIEPLIGGLIRPCGNEELEMRNEKWEITFLSWTGEAGLHLITHC